MITALSRMSLEASAALTLAIFAPLPASADDGPAVVIQGGNHDDHHSSAAGHHSTEALHEDSSHREVTREVTHGSDHGGAHGEEGHL